LDRSEPAEQISAGSTFLRESFIDVWNIKGTISMLKDLMEQFESASERYAADNGMERDDDWFVLKLQEEMGELVQIWNRVTGRGRRKGMSDADLATALADETADVLGHILLFAHRNGLDLPAAVERKWLFRPQA
jgi:NTP pyrophosphatase (non-canonical NTP hydrolase)